MNTASSERLVFFGTDTFSAPSLEALLEAGCQVVGVVTKPDARVGRGRELTSPLVKQIAMRHHLPVFQPAKLSTIRDDLAALNAAAGVVVAYGRIIPESILELFPKGLINVHASLLPAYRGASPIEAAILNGDEQTGVTLMKIAARMDAGGIYARGTWPLDGRETKPRLYESLSRFGAQQLVTHLHAILEGRLKAKPQNERQATYVSLIQKSDGLIDWTKPAATLEREIRAYLGWPGSRAEVCDREVIITAARVCRGMSQAEPGEVICSSGQELIVMTGQDALAIDRLKPAGKREMSAAEFIAGLH